MFGGLALVGPHQLGVDAQLVKGWQGMPAAWGLVPLEPVYCCDLDLKDVQMQPVCRRDLD